MKKLIVILISLFFFQGIHAQTLPSKKIARETCLSVLPDAVIVGSEAEVPPVLLPKKKKVFEIAWSEPCPNGGSGSIIGVYSCFRNSFLDIEWGNVWCYDTTTINNCQ